MLFEMYTDTFSGHFHRSSETAQRLLSGNRLVKSYTNTRRWFRKTTAHDHPFCGCYLTLFLLFRAAPRGVVVPQLRTASELIHLHANYFRASVELQAPVGLVAVQNS